MKLNPLILLFAASAIFITILISGCTEEQANPEAGITTGQPETPPAQNNQPETQASGCTSPYDGTYQGTVSESGMLAVSRPDANGAYSLTQNPFLQTYDFEMTIKCSSQVYTDEGSTGSPNAKVFDITHIKVSHPLFGCTAGCVPISEVNGAGTQLFLFNSGIGSMVIAFPNGAGIVAFNYEGGVKTGPNEDTLTLNIQPYGGSIGYKENPDGTTSMLETLNCEQLGGEGYCNIGSINPNTIILHKVS